MISVKNLPLAILTSLLLVLAACGGSDGDTSAAADDTSTTETAAESTTTEPAATTEATTTTEPAEAGDDAATAGSTVPVSLFEWAVDAPTEIAGGTVTFEVSNIGEFSHEFAIARGDSYETLPLLGNGAVDEEALGADWLGRTDRIGPEEQVTISFDLEPGNYVFLCNIQSGPNSHASQGQVLSVTVVP